jgi:hypothetical protein
VTRYYCQGCDWFIDVWASALPTRCPECGSQHWATFKRGEGPGCSFWPPAPNYLFGPPVPITTTSPYAAPVPRLAP